MFETIHTMGLRALAAVAFATLAVGALAQGTDYPTKPIRVILPYPPGGPADAVGRKMAQSMTETLGQPVVFDNRPGGSGTIGGMEVAKAAPDGYTLLFAISDVFINVNGVLKRVPYDSLRDFEPITEFVSYNVAMMVRGENPARNVGDLLRAVKGSPGKISYGSWGPASYPHLIGETLARQAGAPMIHTPYKGAAPAVQDLLAGVIDVAFLSPGVAAGYAQKGQVRLLAVTGDRRSEAAPDVPTFVEQGVNDPIVRSLPWIGLVAPARTPSPVVQRLHDAAVASLQRPDMQKLLRDLGMEAVGSTPADFRAQLKSDYPMVTEAIRRAGVVPE